MKRKPPKDSPRHFLNKKQKNFLQAFLYSFLLIVTIILLFSGLTFLRDFFLGALKDTSSSSSQNLRYAFEEASSTEKEKETTSTPEIGSLKNKLEKLFSANTQPSSTKPQPSLPLPPTNAPVIPTLNSTFSDIFSGRGWIDENETTMYQDENVMAFIFPPRLNWQKIDGFSQITKLKSLNFLEKREDGSVVSCLANSQCLVKKDLKIFWQQANGSLGQEINLPNELQALIRQGNLVNLSLGALSSKWVIGGVYKNNSQYAALVFYFDGTTFSQLNLPLSFSRQGFLGFGGKDDEWLLIYNDYQGSGYKIKTLANGALKSTDISQFLNVRLMGGGFEPVILRSSRESPALPGKFDTCWYVLSLDKNNPKLIKFFENYSGEIQGAVDLLPLLNLSLGAQVSFQEIGSRQLAAKISQQFGEEEFWLLTDLGFDKSQPLKIVSKNLSHYNAPLLNATISLIDLALADNQVKFFLSTDKKNWRKTSLNQEVSFVDLANANRQELYWKAEFYPSNNPETSIFFKKISIGFYFIKKD